MRKAIYAALVGVALLGAPVAAFAQSALPYPPDYSAQAAQQPPLLPWRDLSRHGRLEA